MTRGRSLYSPLVCRCRPELFQKWGKARGGGYKWRRGHAGRGASLYSRRAVDERPVQLDFMVCCWSSAVASCSHLSPWPTVLRFERVCPLFATRVEPTTFSGKNLGFACIECRLWRNDGNDYAGGIGRARGQGCLLSTRTGKLPQNRTALMRHSHFPPAETALPVFVPAWIALGPGDTQRKEGCRLGHALAAVNPMVRQRGYASSAAPEWSSLVWIDGPQGSAVDGGREWG